MSYKITDAILRKTNLPGRLKRVLCAYASAANADGTGIRLSKEEAARRAGVSRWTVNRNTDELVELGLLVHDQDEAGEPARWYYGRGHYSLMYHMGLEVLATLQTATLEEKKQRSKMHHGQRSKMHPTNVAKRAATMSYDSSPVGSSSDQTPVDPSAVSTAANQSTNQSASPSLEQSENQQGVLEQDKSEDWYWPTLPLSGRELDWPTMMEHLRLCFPAHRTADPTEEDAKMFCAVICKCDENCCYPENLVEHAKAHFVHPKVAKLVPRSVRQLWGAVCGPNVSVTNGLLRQYKDHVPKECGVCVLALKDAKCERCGAKAEIARDGTTRWCKDCAKLPQHRRESGRMLTMTEDA